MRRPQRAAGFTLPELLVAAALGLSVTTGSLHLYQQLLRSYRTAEQLADLEERATFALRALTDDIALAGFWGRHANPAALTLPGTFSIRCSGRDVTPWVLDLGRPLTAADGTLAAPCPPLGSAVTGADSVLVRRAGAEPVALRAGSVQLATDMNDGVVFADGVRPASVGPAATVHPLRVHAWYVDSRSSTAALPALRRLTLVTGGRLHNQEIMPGVEDLQVTLGVDRDRDGLVDGFVNPAAAGSHPVIAVRIWLQVRALRPEPGLGVRTLGPSIDERAGPSQLTDRFRRLTAERTVYAPNLAAAAGAP